MVEGSELTPAQIAQLVEGESEAAITRMAGALALERLLEMALVRTVFVTAPGAGAEWVATVPAGLTWELLIARFVLTTSAVVANRVAQIALRDQDGSTVVQFTTSRNHTASVAIPYSYVSGYGASLGNNVNVEMLGSPPPIASPGWTVRSVTGSLDVGDAYSGIILTVREWAPSRVAQRMRYLLADLDSAGGLV